MLSVDYSMLIANSECLVLITECLELITVCLVSITICLVLTRAVMVFVTERKNNVSPRLQSHKKVHYVQLFSAHISLEFSHQDHIII